MSIRGAFTLTALAIVALCAADVRGQGFPGQPYAFPSPMGGYPAPGGYYGAAGYGGAPVAWAPQDPRAAFGVAQQPYVEPLADGGMGSAGADGSGVSDGGMMGYGYGGHHGRPLGRLLGLLAPYSETNSCTPHWFDIHAEAVFLKREKPGDRVDFTSMGLTVPGATPDIVLSSENLDLGTAPGLRVTGVLQTGPGSNIEFTYLGMTHWGDAASVSSDAHQLWSAFSEFGGLPTGVGFPGYPDVDRADYHAISLKSSVNSVEANYRRRWVGPTCMLQGSWLGGFRYFQLRETLDHTTDAPYNFDFDPADHGFMNYKVTTKNHMYGLQGGGDMWLCIIPGLSIGSELKAGIYGNDSGQRTIVDAQSINPPLVEEANSTDVAFMGELNLMVNYRINHKFTVRGGYMMMYADGVALGAENFNSVPPDFFYPFEGDRKRVVSINNGGNAFWHGWSLGAEYMW